MDTLGTQCDLSTPIALNMNTSPHLSSEHCSVYDSPMMMLSLECLPCLTPLTRTRNMGIRLVLPRHSLVFSQRLQVAPVLFLKLFLCIAPSSPVFCPANPSCFHSLNSDLYLLKQQEFCSVGSRSWSRGQLTACRHKVRLVRVHFIFSAFPREQGPLLLVT